MTDQPILIDDDDRYASLRLIGWWDQSRLARTRIVVVGAGALGNEVLKNLALVGVGHIHIVDFDRVESSNLARAVLYRSGDAGRPKAESAARAVRQLNPDVEVTFQTADVTTDVGLGTVRDADVVIGCLDNREARLWLNRMCWKVTTPWIDGGIQEINGVVKVYRPPDGSCYECTMTETDYRLLNFRYSCPLLRREDLQMGKVPTAPTIAAIIGGLQAQEALKLVHGLPTLDGEALVFNGASNQMYRTRLERRDDCLSHEVYAAPVELPLSAATTTARELLDAVGQHLAVPATSIRLDRDLVTALHCDHCQVERPICRPRQKLAVAEAQCERCGQTMRVSSVHVVAADSPLADQPIQALGIPTYDIVEVVGPDSLSAFVLLAGDRGQPAPADPPRDESPEARALA